MNGLYLDEDLVLNSGYQTSSCYLFASAFTYRQTALLEIHTSQEVSEIPIQHSKKKVKESRNMPSVAQKVPGGLGSHISRH